MAEENKIEVEAIEESTEDASQKIPLVKKIGKFFKNDITLFLLGVILTVITYQLALRDIQPRYTVSEPELLAEQTLDAPNLKLYWDDEEIEDISSVNIAIWNAGRQYLDKNSISETNPIAITIPSGINVLYSEFIRTSRDELAFKTTIETLNSSDQRILIEIEGDEALEKNDGGLVKILYTGEPETEFLMTGRIKGSKDGFVKRNWPSKKNVLLQGFIVFLGGFNGAAIGYSYIWLKSPNSFLFGKPKLKLKALLVTLVVFILLMLGTYLFIGVVQHFPLSRPSWLITL